MEIDLIPLAQLPSRYGIARSNLYNRLKDLKIESVKQGRKAFVTADGLRLLDGLHAHLESGGTTNVSRSQTFLEGLWNEVFS
ncbi:MAG: hypothetical protein QNJ53_06325 [Pleurocapsa sp. MO_192.B19]|nr:hypothetical protein [Pleurocapsa sp. MO_192.B19]